MQVARLLTHVDCSIVLACADFADPSERKDEALATATRDSGLVKVYVPYSRSSWDRLLHSASAKLKVPILNRTPDAFKRWNRHVHRALEPILREQSFDAVVTFGAPMSDHLIGLKLKREYGLPWIAHFSDPWVDNPFTTSDRLTDSLNRLQEKAVIESSDISVFTSAETVDLVFRKYPSSWKQRARVLPHAFDPVLFKNCPNHNNGSIKIRYLGDFYGPRTPEPLVRALAELHKSEPEILKNVTFEFVGNLAHSKSVSAGFESLPKELVVIRSPVAYLESLRLMEEASALLVIDAPSDRSVFLPSKLIDYLGARRPIFGITPSGTAATLIRELNGWIADPGDNASIQNQLKSLLSFLRETKTDSSPVWGNDAVTARFNISTVGEEFIKIIREVTSTAAS